MLRSLMTPVMISVVVLSASQAVATEVCKERKLIINHLAEKYREKTAAVGLTEGGKVMEITVSPDGTWTLITSWPDGQACVLDSGKGWQFSPVGEPS